MKIAFFGDIHGNLPALRAILRDARKHRVDALFHLGDLTGYGPFPNQVVNLVRRLKIDGIVGNYDRKVLRISSDTQWLEKKSQLKQLAFRWAFDHLTKINKTFLASLPEQKILRFEKTFLLVHGSPDSIKEHLSPEVPLDRFKELAKMTQAEIILCAHSHVPFCVKAGGKTFINPGSGGKPDEGDWRASYAVVNFDATDLQVDHYRVEYKLQQIVDEINKFVLPQEFAEIFRRGLPLDKVVKT